MVLLSDNLTALSMHVVTNNHKGDSTRGKQLLELAVNAGASSIPEETQRRCNTSYAFL